MMMMMKKNKKQVPSNSTMPSQSAMKSLRREGGETQPLALTPGRRQSRSESQSHTGHTQQTEGRKHKLYLSSSACRSLNADQDHLPIGANAGVGAGPGGGRRRVVVGSQSLSEYSRIRPSSKTGGYEGSTPHSYHYGPTYYDDETVRADNTVLSSPELHGKRANAGRSRGGRGKGRGQDVKSTETVTNNMMLRRLGRSGLSQSHPGPRQQTQQQTQQQQQHQQRVGFFKRWSSSTKSNASITNNTNSSYPGNADSRGSSRTNSLVVGKQQLDFPVGVQRTKKKQSQSFMTKTTATVVEEPSSDQSFAVTVHPVQGPHSVSTPVRSNATSSPRFILPDETPPGSKSVRPKKRNHNTNSKGSGSRSTVDNTSAAVVHHMNSSSSGTNRLDSSDEQGFEMSIASAPPSYSSPLHSTPPPIHRNNPVDLDDADDLDDSDDDESTVGSFISKLLLTDEELMDESSCSGALRLTEDGLKRLERKTLEGASIAANPSTLKSMRTSSQEREPPSNSCNKSKMMIVSSVSSMLKKKKTVDDDIADFSVAPLTAMDHLNLETTASAATRSRTESDPDRNCMHVAMSKKGSGGLKNWVFPLRRRDSSSVTALALLERERQAALETETKKKFLEMQELMRIEQKRREYLELQRARERDQPQNLSAEQRESIFVSLELVEKDNTASKHHAERQKNWASFTQSTISTTKSAIMLPVCAVCKKRERTHIATPCMHFAYCEECARRLAFSGKGCFVCSRPDVSFAAVSV